MQSLYYFVKHITIRLTEPSPHLQTEDDRRRARLLAAIILFFIPPGFVLAVIFSLVSDDRGQSLLIASTILLLELLVYRLSRTRWYQYGAMLTVANVSVGVFYAMITQQNTNILILLLIGSVLSVVILRIRLALIAITANVFFIILLPFIIPGLDIAGVATDISFIIYMSLLLLLITIVREQDLNRIQKQTDELIETNSQLRAEYTERAALEANFSSVFLNSPDSVIEVIETFLM